MCFQNYCVSLYQQNQKKMTQAELHFYERVPQLLAQLVNEIKNLKDEIAELKEKINEKMRKRNLHQNNSRMA